jgi:hypothetical protein
MAMPGSPRDDWRWIAAASLPGLALLAAQAAWPWPFCSDDAFISLRYAERLLAGHGLTWTDGERVEGYSNLLWVLACAGLGALGLDLVAAARTLGGLCTALACVLLARALRPVDPASALRAAVAPLLAAASQVVLGWTLGGLEGPMALLWLCWGFGALVRLDAGWPTPSAWPLRCVVAAGAPFALLCWTRPDGPLWVAGAAAVLLFATGRGGLWRGLAFAAAPAAAVLAQLGFRVAYYGDVVPNTAHVKADFAPAAWPAGLDYVGNALLAHAGIAAGALVGAGLLFAHRRWRPLALLLAVPLLLWLAYLVAIGGDHFPCRRLLHGALAPLALLAGSGLWALARHRPAGAAALAVVFAAAAARDAQSARTDPQSLELRAEAWEWQGRAIGEALGRAFARERPLLAVDAAGALPFYSRLPALDMLGLCDRTIATTPMPAWLDTVVPGTPKPPGHLRGNGRYVLERAPDLFVFGPPPGRPLPVFVSGAEAEVQPGFLRAHRLVALALPEQDLAPGLRQAVNGNLWVRLDGRVGVQRTQDRIVIPAWLFGSFAPQCPLVRRYQPFAGDAGDRALHGAELARLVAWLQAPPCVATPGADDRLVAELRAAAAALSLHVPAGRWVVALEPPSPGLRVHLAGAPPGDGSTVATADDGEQELVLSAAPALLLPHRVHSIVLERAPD